jgi:hypothetical protein
MMGLLHNLRTELRLPHLESTAGFVLLPFILEAFCKEMGVDLSPKQLEKLEKMTSRLVERLLKIKENEAVFEVEKAYERLLALREFEKEYEGFLTNRQEIRLDSYGRLSGIESLMSRMHGERCYPETTGEQVQMWQSMFGICEDRHTEALTSIAVEYLKSCRTLESKFTGEKALSETEKSDKERNLVDIHVKILRKISQLELTQEQRKNVRNYNVFSPLAQYPLPEISPPSKDKGEASGQPTILVVPGDAALVSKLRELHAAQLMFEMDNARYAATTQELAEFGFMEEGSVRAKGYSIEVTSSTSDKWSATATPADTSKRHYYIDQSRVIRAEDGKSATAKSPVLR